MNQQRNYQRCIRCVMDTTDLWIQFDEKGVCNHCTDFLANRIKVTAYSSNKKNEVDHDISSFFNKIRRKSSSNADYDVIVGVSGGVDSSTVALLSQQAGLRVLAVHMDNGWDTPVAIQNIYKLIAIPGIDYHCEVLDWNVFKQIQCGFFQAGVADLELPTDIAIQAVLHRVALKTRVKVILSGGNIAAEGILPASWLYNARDSHYSRSILKSVGIKPDLFEQISFGLRFEAACRLLYGIKTKYPLNHMLYDKAVARQKLKESIGWQSYGGNHCESTFTRFTQLVYLPIRHQVDYRLCSLSTDICLGKVSREDALMKLEAKPWLDINIQHDLAFIARKLDYTIAQLESLMHDSPRWYSDYPNREQFLGFVYSCYRLLTGQRKNSNF